MINIKFYLPSSYKKVNKKLDVDKLDRTFNIDLGSISEIIKTNKQIIIDEVLPGVGEETRGSLIQNISLEVISNSPVNNLFVFEGYSIR